MFKNILVSLSVMATASGVVALEKPKEATVKAAFEKSDINKDGAIQAHEMLKEAKAYFDYLDANHDMKIDAAELPDKNMATLARLIALDHSMMVKGKIVGEHLTRDKFIKELDSNKDNSISAGEFMKPMMSVFKETDKDHDKKVTLAEFSKRIEVVSKMSYYKNYPTRHHLLNNRNNEALGGIKKDEMMQAGKNR